MYHLRYKYNHITTIMLVLWLVICIQDQYIHIRIIHIKYQHGKEHIQAVLLVLVQTIIYKWIITVIVMIGLTINIILH